MIPRTRILLYLIGALAAGPCALALNVFDWPALNTRTERQLDVGESQQALSDALLAYRKLAREKYDLAAIHACARNLAILNRAAQETVSLLARGNETGALLDAGAFYKSLTNLGRVKAFPTDGLTSDEMKFLALLQRAMLCSCHGRVAAAFGGGENPARRDYLFAYLLATREPERTDRLLDDLPQALQTTATLQAFASYCASVNRKDLAAAICMESANRSAVQDEATAFYNSAAGHYLAGNDIGSAVEAFRQVLSRFPRSPKAPETQIRIIELIADRWRSYGTAVKECETFLAKYPESDKVEAIKMRMGYLYYQNKEFDRGIRYFEALVKDPAMADMEVQGRFFLSFCYMGKGENDTANEILNEIVAKHPDHPLAPRAQFVLAKAYLSRQDYVRAQEELKMLVALYPNSEYARQGSDILQSIAKAEEKKAQGAPGSAEARTTKEGGK